MQFFIMIDKTKGLAEIVIIVTYDQENDMF